MSLMISRSATPHSSTFRTKPPYSKESEHRPKSFSGILLDMVKKIGKLLVLRILFSQQPRAANIGRSARNRGNRLASLCLQPDLLDRCLFVHKQWREKRRKSEWLIAIGWKMKILLIHKRSCLAGGLLYCHFPVPRSLRSLRTRSHAARCNGWNPFLYQSKVVGADEFTSIVESYLLAK